MREAEPTDAQVDAVLARGRTVRLHEPRAAGVRYDRDSGRVIVALANGCTFAFPARLAEALAGATNEQLAQAEVLGAGSGLHWEALDVDLSIAGLLAGLFGTRAALARQAGRASSPAKAAAARANGAKGGRPRRSARVRRASQVGQEGKQFFFEKKNQETSPDWDGGSRAGPVLFGKSFCFFFFRKRRPCFLPYALSCRSTVAR